MAMSRIWPNGGTQAPYWPDGPRPGGVQFRSTNEFGTSHDLTVTHRGIDLVGFTDVRAVADGRVVFSGSNGTAGYEIKIRHTDLTATRYLHMQAGSLKFITGQTVKQGDVLGKLGATGYVTGPHLHFECIDTDDNRRINPRLYISEGSPASGGSTPFDPNGDNELNADERAMLQHIYNTLTPGIEGVKFNGVGYNAILDARDNAIASKNAAVTASDAVTPGIAGVKFDGVLYSQAKKGVDAAAGNAESLKRVESVVVGKIPRQGGAMGGETDLRSVIAWSDQNTINLQNQIKAAKDEVVAKLNQLLVKNGLTTQTAKQAVDQALSGTILDPNKK